MNQINNAEKSLADLAEVIKNKSSLIIQNPSLNKVVFEYGSFGDLTEEKSAGGNGIVHIIQRRAEIDGLSEKDIASLLLKIKDIAEIERVTGYDETGTRAFINKDGIRVLLQKNWNKNMANWLVTGYGIMDSTGNLSLEAAETIKTVNVQYSYKPEHSLLREQVGAVIASISNIRQQQLKVKRLKASTKIEKGTKRVSSANPRNVYEKAVLKDNPKNCSDKELLTAFAASTHAQNALKNTSNSELYKNTKNKSILESAGNQELINKISNELQARGYALSIESTFNETNVHFQHQIFIDVGNGKEKKLSSGDKAASIYHSSKLNEKLSAEDGSPSINHLEDSRLGSPLSALADNERISQNNNLANQQSQDKNMPGQSTIHAFTSDEKKMSENRFDLLKDKTEITTEEIGEVIELKHEYADMKTLPKYTDKNFREMSVKEKESLIAQLLKDDYLKYKNCYIARSKLLYDTSETLVKEISIVDKLNDLGYEIYLLPYGYARDSMNCYQKSADSISSGNFLEFKTVVSTGKYAGQSVYSDGIRQADNIFISLLNETSEEKVINNIYKVINEKKRLNKQTGKTTDFSSLIFLNFEKDNNRTVLYRFDKEGKGLRLDNPTFENLKKCLEDAKGFQVQENPMTEHSSSPKQNISQNQNLSNQKKLMEEKIMPGQNTIHAFTDDEKKMADFNELAKREFLDSHSDVNEDDYDATAVELKEKGEYTVPWNIIKEILGKDKSGELDYERNLHFDEAYEPEEKNFLSKFDAAYFTIEKYISHRGLDMDTYKDLFGDISEEKAIEIEDEKRDILGPEVVEELIKGPADINGHAAFEDFTDIQQAYDRALIKSKTYQKIVSEELQQAIGKRDNLFVNNIADYLNSAMRHYDEKCEPETAKKCEDILSEALFTAETEVNTEAFKTLLENGANVTYRKTEAINGKEHKANILHYIAADDNIEALSLLMDGVPPYEKPFDRLSAGEKLSLLREQNFEGRTPLEVSENYYREEPSRYEPDMIMPDVMRELAYQEEDLMSHVPPLVLADKLTGNILMVEQSNGDGCEINLFDRNKKLVDHDISSGYTNNFGESADYESSLEAARVSMAEYEKQNLWGNFYEYEKVPTAVSQIQDLRNSRDEFFKALDDFDKNLNPKLSEINEETPFNSATAKFTTFIPKEVFDKLGINIEENEDFYRLVISLNKDGKVDEWYLDAGSAMAGVGENIDVDFSEEEKKKFNFVFEKVNDAIREKYPSIEKLISMEEKGTRTVTQSVTFPAHFLLSSFNKNDAENLTMRLQERYGFGDNDYERFVGRNGNVPTADIHFAVPVPKEYQFPKSKTNEWIKSVCKDLEENFGASDVAVGMDGSERVEKVFGTAEEAEKFVTEKQQKKQNIEIKPVKLEEILAQMDISLETLPNGKYKLYDQQTNEYRINNDHLFLDKKDYNDEDYKFSSATEIFKNLDALINDYYINDMREVLEEQGINTDKSSTLKELCELYKNTIEKGNAELSNALSIGELELAMGIVHPNTVIMPEKVVEQSRKTAFLEERNTVVAVGVAPTIQTLRTRASSTALRASTTTITESIAPQTQESSEVQFKNFVKEVEAEYKDLRLFRKATVNVLKRLSPEQKATIKSELLKRGANNPESLALVMKNEVQKQHSQKKNQERTRNRNDDYVLER